LLIAALPAPYGRRLLLGEIVEELVLPEGRAVALADIDGTSFGGGLVEFRLELGLPVWLFEIGDIAIEKRLVLAHAQNTVHVVYRLIGGADTATLKLKVVAHNRSHDAPVNYPLPDELAIEQHGDERYEIGVLDLPRLRLLVRSRRTTFTAARDELPPRSYPLEESRGYRQRGSSFTPGYFFVELDKHEPAALVASAEPWELMTALSPAAALDAERERRLRRLEAAGAAADDELGAALVLAADQFIVEPIARSTGAARPRDAGARRTVIAGYHWFTDWGRDTMIGLEGLALVTGRHAEAEHILETFTHDIRDGLLPNVFPEGEREGLYHTADATLWLFHALDRYVERTGNRALLEKLLPRLVEVAERHVTGTRFGIGVDPEDGLLEQGAEGYQLTWMDAKVDDWVVTPRRGKTVEINALWYNAICVLARWLRHAGRGAEADDWLELAAQARESFNRRFWNDGLGYLYDVVDGEYGHDSSCRPNQVLAISLPNAVLDSRHWSAVLDVVRRRLLTPFGLRSLAPGHADYRPRYEGDIYSRDAAYHQGTVWPWLIGPFVDAWLKTHPNDTDTARGFLDGFAAHLDDGCLGTIGEIVDAEPPHTPRGCISQAWSVAEVLRCSVKLRAARRVETAARGDAALAAAQLEARAGPLAVAGEEHSPSAAASARRP
jgi:predicted glycogen debranching enzyme